MPRLTKNEKAKIEAKRKARHEEVATALRDGCPICGSKIKRNLSITGWWQCSQFGAIGFRINPDQPSCSWQAFAD